MGIRARWFNTNLLLLMALALLAGCQTESRLRKRQVTRLGVHLEVRADHSASSGSATVFRDNPKEFTIQREPFLNEGMIASARLIETLGGGFAISLQFDDHGARLLEIYSAQNPGKRVVISCQFGKRLEHRRNLAAPVIPRRIANGVLAFTPDADREEAEEIVYGLNNLASKIEKSLFTER